MSFDARKEAHNRLEEKLRTYCLSFRSKALVGEAFRLACKQAVEEEYDLYHDGYPSWMTLRRVEKTTGMHFCEAWPTCAYVCWIFSDDENEDVQYSHRWHLKTTTSYYVEEERREKIERKRKRMEEVGYGMPTARTAVTTKLRLVVFARDGHVCVQCGAQPPLELDHIIPVARGGSSELNNLQSLCKPCNRKKGASLLRAA